MRRAYVLGLLAAACAEVELVEPPRPPRLAGPVPAIGRTLDLEVQGRGTPVRLRGVTGRVTAVCVLGADASGAPPLPASGRSVQAPAPGWPGAEAVPARARREGGRGGVRPTVAAAGAGDDAAGERGAVDEGVEAADDGPPPGSLEPVPVPPAQPPPPALGRDASRILEACAGLARDLADRIAVVGLATDPALDLDRLVLRTYLDPEGAALAEALELDATARILLVDRQGRVAELLGAHELHRAADAATRLAF